MSNPPILSCRDLQKTYAGLEVSVLNGINRDI